MDARIIPVFPLDLVLFPRQELPLVIFEPRYKQMVDDCMSADGLFGVCLADSRHNIMGWEAPVRVGTMTKIAECRDEGLDGMRQHLRTVGRNRFKILDIMPPALGRPDGYDPHTLEGHRVVADIYEQAGSGGRMYIQARVEMLREIDGNVSLREWQELVEMWKRMVIRNAESNVEPSALDRLLEQYYLDTETPTTDYIYSLAALGAAGPADLQPVLEADTAGELLGRVRKLMTVK